MHCRIFILAGSLALLLGACGGASEDIGETKEEWSPEIIAESRKIEEMIRLEVSAERSRIEAARRASEEPELNKEPELSIEVLHSAKLGEVGKLALTMPEANTTPGGDSEKHEKSDANVRILDISNLTGKELEELVQTQLSQTGILVIEQQAGENTLERAGLGVSIHSSKVAVVVSKISDKTIHEFVPINDDMLASSDDFRSVLKTLLEMQNLDSSKEIDDEV